MRINNYLLGFILLIGVLSSCAHKSGHLKQQRVSSQKVFSNNGPVVDKPKSSNSKLEGNQIFTKYSTEHESLRFRSISVLTFGERNNGNVCFKI